MDCSAMMLCRASISRSRLRLLPPSGTSERKSSPPKKYLELQTFHNAAILHCKCQELAIRERESDMASSMLEPGIFRHPRPKKSLLPPPSKKRKAEHKIEEISFDNDARADYLTGFHKRKVARAKQAQLEAAKKAREERVLMRKQVGGNTLLDLVAGLVEN
jgi:hypothetical protein